MWTRYPRTPHLPWSPGATEDDVRVGDLSGLAGREVVVTEKLDGENTTLYPDGLHARSLDSAHHPSRTWVKALHGRIAAAIPAGWRICGENVYARHSIAYRELSSWFYAFSVWNGDYCLGWDDTVRFARRLGIPVPPVLWRGVFDERAVRALRLDTTRQEGYVVRTVDGFGRTEFPARMAKWVRPAHVRTDQHWMLGPVVANGRRPAAALWEVRAGLPVELPAVLAALGMTVADLGEPAVLARAEAASSEVSARLDLLGRAGDARLAGVLAAALHGIGRTRLVHQLVAPLGLSLARRVADLVGLHARLHHAFPDEDRRAGLVRMAVAADLGVLHAVAASVLAPRHDDDAAEAREQVDWSMAHAEDAALLGEDPLASLRTELRAKLSELDTEAADRCWAETRSAFADGRISTAAEAVAYTWRWRSGDFPRLIHLIGPSGSGKSTFVRTRSDVDQVVSLDDLRRASGDRADQRANQEILHTGLATLDGALVPGATVVWDATSLNRHQRAHIGELAARRNALVTHVVSLVDPAELARRNATRDHPVPAEVLAGQLARFAPPFPGDAHRTWYLGAAGTVEDVAGSFDAEA
jgi:predicted kinase